MDEDAQLRALIGEFGEALSRTDPLPDKETTFGYRYGWEKHLTTGRPIMAIAAHPRSGYDRKAYMTWKADPIINHAHTEKMVAELVRLIRLWFPYRNGAWLVTTPPQGASKYQTRDGIYPAGIIGKAVATELGLDYVTTVARSSEKTRHGKAETLRQPEFRRLVQPGDFTLVIDDMCTSGATLARTIEALGAPAFCFVWCT